MVQIDAALGYQTIHIGRFRPGIKTVGKGSPTVHHKPGQTATLDQG